MAADPKKTPLTMPALRGTFGDWTYYSCLMPLRDLASRVSYADDIHESKALSELIQRTLEGKRAQHIAAYLNTPERFFNALVLATYGGNPEWFEVGNFKSSAHADILAEVAEEAMDALGFLRLGAKAKIFALDGQHRLAGIREALSDGSEAKNDVVSVLLVGHKTTASGLQRTRRLFTTLNKTAVPVRKKDIIALDEDDVMAIIARRLVETNDQFRDPRIAVIGSPNIPVGNRTCLTTITNLYDVLKILFLFETKNRTDRHLRFNRPSDERLDHYYRVATDFFTALSKAFAPVRGVMNDADPEAVTSKQRGAHGGHLLFRPIGLELFTRLATALAKSRSIELQDAVELLKVLPVDLTKAPYAGVIWDSGRSTIKTTGKTLALDLMRHMVGLETRADLLGEYRRTLGGPNDQSIKLPAPLGI